MLLRAARSPSLLRSSLLSSTLAIACATSLSACGGSDQTRPVRDLRVAEGGSRPEPPGELVVVNARDARTSIGHFRAGQRVRIAIVDTQWTHEPSERLFDAHGVPGKNCVPTNLGGCAATDAPLMGLVLLTVPDVASSNVVPGQPVCVVRHRLYAPTGVEFLVPVQSDLALAPNDWEDGLWNNVGALQVTVERAAAQHGPALEKTVYAVQSTEARTSIGRFEPGEYVRISVTGGTWTNDPGAPRVGPVGQIAQKCGAPGHTCIGGDGVPLMGLVLLMSECSSSPQHVITRPTIERRFIPDGILVELQNDAELFLAPNDVVGDLANNSGSARVKVQTVAAPRSPGVAR